MRKQLKADLYLISVSVIWGSTFVLTKDALQHIPTYNFLSLRFLIATAVLILLFRERLAKMGKTTFINGALIGLFLFAGYAFQTVGLNYTTASKSGFITGFSAVIVPILSALLLRKKPEFMAVLGVTFAIVGLGLLTLEESFLPNLGDFYTFLCTIAFAMQIILISKYTPDSDSIALATVQIGVVGILSTAFTLWLEQPVIPVQPRVWIALLVTSLLATTYAIAIQNVMQKFTSPTHTALIFTGEPVFAALFAYLLLGEVLTFKQGIGCILILAGMLVSELKPSRNKEGRQIDGIS